MKRSDLPNNQKEKEEIEEIEVEDDGQAEDRWKQDPYVSSTSGDCIYVTEEKFEALLRRVTHLESIVNKL